MEVGGNSIGHAGNNIAMFGKVKPLLHIAILVGIDETAAVNV